MAATYTTRQLDELDLICFRYYGGTQGSVEAVLSRNPGLADMLPILPPGVVITLPDLPKPVGTATLLRFWGVL